MLEAESSQRAINYTQSIVRPTESLQNSMTVVQKFKTSSFDNAVRKPSCVRPKCCMEQWFSNRIYMSRTYFLTRVQWISDNFTPKLEETESTDQWALAPPKPK